MANKSQLQTTECKMQAALDNKTVVAQCCGCDTGVNKDREADLALGQIFMSNM